MKQRCVDCHTMKTYEEFLTLKGSFTGRSCVCISCQENYDLSQTAGNRRKVMRTKAVVARVKQSDVAKAQNRAMKVVREAIANGMLKKENCAECGDKYSQPSHLDTNHPLEVEWYCVGHHPFAMRCVRCRELRVSVDFPLRKKNLLARALVCKICQKEESYRRHALAARTRVRQEREAAVNAGKVLA